MMQKNWNLFNFFSDETTYKRYFIKETAPQLYQDHVEKNFINCVFCTHLHGSHCHEHCYSCTKKTYTECSALLPGVFHFKDSYFDALDFIPWIFRTPCTNFERLESSRYFKHFISKEQEVTIANFEVLEGIFLGISRGQRPCHICASVNLEIFNRCSESQKTEISKPCRDMLEEISKIYHAASNMIIYAG